MYKKFCDRCGRVTKNKYAFLLPVEKDKGSYVVDGVVFGNNGVDLCNNCLREFDNFRIEHLKYNTILDEEDK